MPRPRARNLTLAGLFIVLMGAVLAAILVLVGGRAAWFEPMQEVRVRFEQAPNVKVGSAVLLVGQPIGRVLTVRPVRVQCPPPAEPETCFQAEVTLALPEQYTIYENARVVIMQSLVGQMANINIEDTGFGDPLQGVLEGNQKSPFADAAGELGIGEVEKTNIQLILANLKDLSEELKTDVPPVVERVKQLSGDLAAVSGDLKEHFPKLRGDLVEAAGNLKEATETAQGAVAKLDALLEENGPKVSEALTDARNFAGKLDAGGGKLLENAAAASEDLKVALADVRVMAAGAKGLIAANKTGFSRTVHNMLATSENLKALAKEVRRAPWRLFAKPEKEEVESINLYDAARAFASTATELETVADTLTALKEAKEAGIEVDPEFLNAMLERLQETFENYQDAEEALWAEFERISQ